MRGNDTQNENLCVSVSLWFGTYSPYLAMIWSFFKPSIPYFWPILVKAARALSRCSISCPAEIWVRILACPWATTGKKKPVTYIPSAYRSRAMSWDSLALYSITGTMGVSPALRSNPALVSPSRQYLVFFSSLSRRSVDLDRSSRTLMDPATTAGGMVLEKR